MIMEIWKDIYEGDYQISNYGNVKSLKFGKEKLLKPGIVYVINVAYDNDCFIHISKYVYNVWKII